MQNENHKLTYQLKEQKVINTDQAKELKKQNEINQVLVSENKILRNQKRDRQFKHVMAGAVGIIAGISISK